MMSLFGPPDVEQLKAKQDVRGLIKALDYQKDGDIRKTAAQALGGLKDASAFEPLVAALKDGDGLVRRAAVHALGELKDARAVEPLIAALRDEFVRSEAAQALADLKDVRAVEPLIAALKDSKYSTEQSACAKALGRLKDARAVAPLIEALANNGTIPAAAEALGELGDHRAIEPLVAKLGIGIMTANEQLVPALVKLGQESLEPLLGALRDGKKRDMRVYAAQTLGLLGDPGAVEPLIKALDDTDAMVFQAVAKALGMLRDQRAVKPLISKLNGNKHLPMFEIALLRIGGDEAEQAAYEYWLAHPNAPNNWPTDTALAVIARADRMSDSRAVNGLSLLLKYNYKPVQDAAAAALKRISGGTPG